MNEKHDERFSASGKMKTEKLCKLLISSLTIPLNGIMVTDFSMLEKSIMILLGWLISEKISCLQSIFNIKSCLMLLMANCVTNKWIIRQNINCDISVIFFFDWRILLCFTVKTKFFFSFSLSFFASIKAVFRPDQKSLFSFSGFVSFFTGAYLCDNFLSACPSIFLLFQSVSGYGFPSQLQHVAVWSTASSVCQRTRYFKNNQLQSSCMR